MIMELGVGHAGRRDKSRLFTAPGQEPMIGGFMNVTFMADDVEATARELKARGVEFAQEAQKATGARSLAGELPFQPRAGVRPVAFDRSQRELQILGHLRIRHSREEPELDDLGGAGVLGYQPIAPELRENCGELEAAHSPRAAGARESSSQLRGDLHTHTHWSADGKATLEEMAAAAAARGYEYYAITDHSHYLREGRLAAQLDEIEKLREQFPKLRILAGVEANIRSNGEVDVPEAELARLDWVVASVHHAPENRPTERVLEAMENPYVDCIGHLTGRRIGTRGPRDVTSSA